MPAVYAHQHFGDQVKARLKGELRHIVKTYSTEFQIGLQGPDLFFFYRPFQKNDVIAYGSALHHKVAAPFFLHAARVVRKRGTSGPEYAYLLGFCCHYILDSEAHPYVDGQIEKTGVHHFEIEEEFDKLLLRMDGHNPYSYPIAELIPTDRKTARAIAPFYRGVNKRLVRKSLQWMRFVKRVLTAPGDRKYALIDGLMRLSGKYDEAKGLMYQRTDNPACAESNAGLLLRLEQSVPLAVEMIEQLDRTVRTGAKLHSRFYRDFE